MDWSPGQEVAVPHPQNVENRIASLRRYHLEEEDLPLPTTNFSHHGGNELLLPDELRAITSHIDPTSIYEVDPSLPRHLKPREPPLFHGADGQRPSRWLQKVKTYFLAINLKPTAWPLHASLMLTGSAEVWHNRFMEEVTQTWKTIPEDQRKPISWTVFGRELCLAFRGPTEVEEARAELATLQQGEHLWDYVTRWTELSWSVPNRDIADQIDFFINGLKFKTRWLVKNHLPRPQNMPQVIRLAFHYDQQVQAQKREAAAFRGLNQVNQVQRPWGRRQCTWKRKSPNFPITKKIDKRASLRAPTRVHQVQSFKPPFHRQPSRNGSSIRCYNCKGFGHIARDCPEPPTAETLRQRQLRAQGRPQLQSGN